MCSCPSTRPFNFEIDSGSNDTPPWVRRNLYSFVPYWDLILRSTKGMDFFWQMMPNAREERCECRNFQCLMMLSPVIKWQKGKLWTWLTFDIMSASKTLHSWPIGEKPSGMYKKRLLPADYVSENMSEKRMRLKQGGNGVCLSCCLEGDVAIRNESNWINYNLFSRMRSAGSRFTLGVWGQGCVRPMLRLRSQPSATVRNRLCDSRTVCMPAVTLSPFANASGAVPKLCQVDSLTPQLYWHLQRRCLCEWSASPQSFWHLQRGCLCEWPVASQLYWRLQSRSVPRKCQIRMSYKCVKKACQARVPHKSVK